MTGYDRQYRRRWLRSVCTAPASELTSSAQHSKAGEQGEWQQGFGAWWSGLCSFATADPELFAFLETHHHAPYLDADSRSVAIAIDDAAAADVAEGQAAGVFRAGDAAALVASSSVRSPASCERAPSSKQTVN